ncbi:Threonine/homoserine/homoserine lactone efflux protein [Bacillus sp. OV322]|uniref:LysE family translocator n=1 Tax=Bacillus sp. OV322 TaxID=1882764 RepID=UPI0008DFAB36|nr:LysE family transporter [Bacillus sp. OV322]SFC67602.1 Threonine/homoserine/homoserine lactone efflux protein [Bacillus sp. OV322]
MLLLKSFILGFSVSAPIGPIGLLCIQRVLLKGRSAGFLTGLGAATANIIYAGIAAFGFSAISFFLVEKQLYFKIIGSLFLLYLGIKTYFKKSTNKAADLDGSSLFRMYASTLLLMITNPVTILNFAGMFAGFGFEQNSSPVQTSILLISGVFLGAISWWIILSLAVSILRTKITPYMDYVNKIAGLLIVILALLNFIHST